MPKKTDRVIKPVKSEKGDRWTVRGVPARLQKAAGDVARARGLTLGQWLSDVLADATARAPRAAAAGTGDWNEAMERLARLESEVFGDDAPRTSRETVAGNDRPSAA